MVQYYTVHWARGLLACPYSLKILISSFLQMHPLFVHLPLVVTHSIFCSESRAVGSIFSFAVLLLCFVGLSTNEPHCCLLHCLSVSYFCNILLAFYQINPGYLKKDCTMAVSNSARESQTMNLIDFFHLFFNVPDNHSQPPVLSIKLHFYLPLGIHCQNVCILHV
jgi:hypothetical protein